jgi:hypothetical protein
VAREAFIHLNGVIYQLPERYGTEHDTGFRSIKQQMADLASGSGGTQVTVTVLINGNKAELHTTPQGVFAAAAFLTEEKPASPSGGGHPVVTASP